MNRRTADRIRHLSKELLAEEDQKRIVELSAELRAELRNHLKHLRDRLAVTEIRERRVRNGSTYDQDLAADGADSMPADDSSPSVRVDIDPTPSAIAAKPVEEPQVQAKNNSENPKNGRAGIKAN